MSVRGRGHRVRLVGDPRAPARARSATRTPSSQPSRTRIPAICAAPGRPSASRRDSLTRTRCSSSVDLDAAIVAVPHDAHASVAAPCLDGGLHVLVEKPLTIDPADAADLVARAAPERRELIVGLSVSLRAGLPGAPRHASPAGRIGRLELVTGLFASVVRELYGGVRSPTGTCWATPSMRRGRHVQPSGRGGGGQAQTQVTHLAALLLWLTGLRPVSVSAVTASFGLAVDLVDALTIRFEGAPSARSRRPVGCCRGRTSSWSCGCSGTGPRAPRCLSRRGRRSMAGTTVEPVDRRARWRSATRRAPRPAPGGRGRRA